MSFGRSRLRVEESTNSLGEHVLDAVLAERRALHVLDRMDVAGERLTLLHRYGRLVLILQLLLHLRVVAQVALGAHKEDRHVGAVVRHLRMPLMLDVLVGGRAGDGEADDKHVGLGVGERAQPVVFLLPRRVPQVEADCPAVHTHLRAVVVEHGGDVLFGESASGVRDEQAGFPHCTISHNHTLDALHAGWMEHSDLPDLLQQSPEKETHNM